MSGTDRRGSDIRRRILHPSTGFDQEIERIRRLSPPAHFYRGVIVEFLGDPGKLSEDRLTTLQEMIVNPTYLRDAPRGSVIVRIITNARDRKSIAPFLCYPFLPPHIALPAKPGEQVWVMFENEEISTGLGYWLWRVPEPRSVDDLNYTHGDRKFDRSAELSTSDRAQGGKNETPGFPNGGSTWSSLSLAREGDYEKIVNESDAYKEFVPEPVPRFTKRPGDTVLQGSNNTLVVLGEDRTGEGDGQPESGAIDIVAGRGRPIPAQGEDPSGTAPRVVENARGNLETDKDPEQRGKSDNPQEGEPDLINDASRLLVSMRSDGDQGLGLTNKYPKPFDTGSPAVSGVPYVIMKSDEVRLVSREDGSVRLVKEGEPGGDQSAILMLPDGTVRIDGNMIYIGRPGGQGPGKGGSEPYIKFSKYKSQMEELIGIMSDLMSVFLLTFPIPDPPVTGGPSPSLQAALTSDKGVTDALASLTLLKKKLDEARSSRIFGE